MTELRLSHEEQEDIQELTASRRYKTLLKIMDHYAANIKSRIHDRDHADEKGLVYERGKGDGSDEMLSILNDLKEYVRGAI